MDWQTIAVWLILGVVVIIACTRMMRKGFISSRRKPSDKCSSGDRGGCSGCDCGCGCG